jgi:hypothetical protein
VTHVPGTSNFVVNTPGAYRISYNFFYETGSQVALGLAVNGTVDPSTSLSVTGGAAGQQSEFGGNVILSLNAGDVVSVVNSGPNSIVLGLTALGVGAQLTFEGLG